MHQAFAMWWLVLLAKVLCHHFTRVQLANQPSNSMQVAGFYMLLTVATLLCWTDAPSRGGSDMFPDSPRQLTAEAGIPWASSATTLSPSGSSLARMLGSDPIQDPKHAHVAGSLCSPKGAAAKEMESEQTLSVSSVAKQDSSLNQSVTAGSACSPCEAAAKQVTSEHTAKPVVSPFETALKSRLPQLAMESKT